MADPKRGEIYFNIALTLVKLRKLDEINKYLKLALKYSSKNNKIKNSELHELYNCNLIPKNLCDSKPPKPYKIEGSGFHNLNKFY